jgi:sulfite reductase (NADPH) hemoprotein beta-component
VLGDIADKYDRGYGHFTTRQNIQYNWIKLEDTPDILADLARSRCTPSRPAATASATFQRPVCGRTPDEIIDPRPYAELLRQWSSFHPEFWPCRASSRSA